MWSDNETTEDLLGFQVHADLIRSIVTDPEMLPVTIGVFGDWGSGKTSVMRMLEKSFNPANYEEGSEEQQKCQRIACLYFNGWLFEGYDDAKSAILSSILLQLGEHKRFGLKVQNKVVGLLKSVNYMRLARLGLQSVALPALTAYISGGASLVPGLTNIIGSFLNTEGTPSENANSEESETKKKEKGEGTDWEELIKTDKTPSGPLDVRSFRSQFSELIAQCEIDSLVVLIDDLDRCSPERIIDNLEAIKLFLNAERTAFVIGADPRIVRHAIETRYKPSEIQKQDDQKEAGHRLVLDYLEKLIQIPYHLPRLSPAEVETYMVLLFCSRDLEKEKLKKCFAAFESLRSQDRYTVFGYTNVKDVLGEQEVPDSLSKSLTFCAASAPSITEGLKGNPRQVKRFLNAFVLRKQLAEVAELKHIRDEVLVKLMVLEYGHPERYYQLYEWQGVADGFPKEIQILESNIRSSGENINNKKSNVLPSDKNMDSKEDAEKKSEMENAISGWETSSIQKWIAMEPSLSEVDLRDYFWISRDRIQSTFSGISMVSPIVRRILEELVSGNSGKRNSAGDGAVDLNEDEKSSLLTQLEEFVHRHPDQKQGYEALIVLIEKNIDGAAERLVHVLGRVPDQSIPPAIGFPLSALAKKPELMAILQPTIDRLMETKSRIGMALKKRNLGN